MTIYSVQVYYDHKRFYLDAPGLHVDFSQDEKTDKVHSDVEAEVEERLTKAGYVWRHEYSWPDGSIFKWIKTDKDADQFEKDLNELFKTIERYQNVVIRVSDPKEDPYKFRKNKKTGRFEEVSTLEEYMGG